MKNLLIGFISIILFSYSFTSISYAMNVSINYSLSKTSGDVDLNYVYLSSHNVYKLNVQGNRASDIEINNDFSGSSNDVTTDTNILFDSKNGYINAKEQLGSIGASEIKTDDLGFGTGVASYSNSAVGTSVNGSSTIDFSTSSTLSNGDIGYNIQKLKGNGTASIGVYSHSYNYKNTTDISCPFSKGSVQVPGTEVYDVYKQKIYGSYNYNGKIIINK